MPHGTFFILRKKLDALRNYKKMSIGEIAMVLYKSKSEVMAQVKNLGLGGIAFDGDVGTHPDVDTIEMDLLMAEKGIYLHNVPYSVLSADAAVEGEGKAPSLRTDAFQFTDLGAEHKQLLGEMLAHGVPSS